MQFARDVLARRLIEADQVTDRDRPYRCPVCDGRVTHAEGILQVAHFRHHRGQGKPECELYYPGNGAYANSGSRFAPTPRTQQAAQKFAHLTLRLDDAGTGNWRLYVSLPPASGRGYVKLRVGPSEALRVIDVSALNNRWWHQAVVACHEPLGVIKTSKDVDPRYAERIRASETSLNSNGVTVFSVSEFDRYLRRAAKLFWGASYYLVFDAKRDLDVPHALHPRELKRRDGFRCTLITLPTRSRKDIVDWIEREAKLVPAMRSAKVTLLFPCAHKVDNGLPTLLPRAEEVLLLVQRQAIEPNVPPELWLETESGHCICVLNEDQLAFVKIPIRQSDKHFYLRFADEGGALFQFADRELDQNSVHAAISINDGSRLTIAPAYSKSARYMLQRARDGRAEIARVEMPDWFEMQVSTRAAGEALWTNVSDGPLASVTELQALLRDQLRDVALDLGPLGVLRFKAPRESPKEVRTLSPQNRSMVKWLLSQYEDGLRALSAHGDDGDLVAALGSIELQGRHLAHYRTIRNTWDITV